MKEVAELHLGIHRIEEGLMLWEEKRHYGDFYIKGFAFPSLRGFFMPRGLDRFILS